MNDTSTDTKKLQKKKPTDSEARTEQEASPDGRTWPYPGAEAHEVRTTRHLRLVRGIVDVFTRDNPASGIPGSSVLRVQRIVLSPLGAVVHTSPEPRVPPTILIPWAGIEYVTPPTAAE